MIQPKRTLGENGELWFILDDLSETDACVLGNVTSKAQEFSDSAI